MRKRFVYIIAGTIVAIAASVTSAYANHGHATLAVPECQAYINVLETADQLYLCRTTAVELSHGDPLDALSTSSAVLVLETLGAPIRTVALNRPGFGLAAIYFAAADVDIPVWNSSTTFLFLEENPAFFPSPATSTPATPPVFNVNVDISDTTTEITKDIPKMMLLLEINDPTIAKETYVLGTAITEVGKLIVVEAFGPLGILAVGAFGLPIEDAGGIFTNPGDPAFVVAFESTGRASVWAQELEALGIEFGFPYVATVLILMILILVILIVAVWKTSGETSTIYLWIWPIMFIGSTIDGWPLAATIMVAVISAGLTISIIINRNISS